MVALWRLSYCMKWCTSDSEYMKSTDAPCCMKTYFAPPTRIWERYWTAFKCVRCENFQASSETRYAIVRAMPTQVFFWLVKFYDPTHAKSTNMQLVILRSKPNVRGPMSDKSEARLLRGLFEAGPHDLWPYNCKITLLRDAKTGRPLPLCL
jgi:hypothetical protein